MKKLTLNHYLKKYAIYSQTYLNLSIHLTCFKKDIELLLLL